MRDDSSTYVQVILSNPIPNPVYDLCSGYKRDQALKNHQKCREKKGGTMVSEAKETAYLAEHVIQTG